MTSNDEWVDDTTLAIIPSSIDCAAGYRRDVRIALQEAIKRGKAEQHTFDRGTGAWPKEVREAIEQIENEHDISVVSIEHHAKWVNQVKSLEAKLAEQDKAVAEAVAKRDAAIEYGNDAQHSIAHLGREVADMEARAEAAEAKLARLDNPDEAIQSCFVVYELQGVLAACRALVHALNCTEDQGKNHEESR